MANFFLCERFSSRPWTGEAHLLAVAEVAWPTLAIICVHSFRMMGFGLVHKRLVFADSPSSSVSLERRVVYFFVLFFDIKRNLLTALRQNGK